MHQDREILLRSLLPVRHQFFELSVRRTRERTASRQKLGVTKIPLLPDRHIGLHWTGSTGKFWTASSLQEWGTGQSGLLLSALSVAIPVKFLDPGGLPLIHPLAPTNLPPPSLAFSFYLLSLSCAFVNVFLLELSWLIFNIPAKPSKSHKGAIIGGVLGGFFGVSRLLFFLFFFCLQRTLSPAWG